MRNHITSIAPIKQWDWFRGFATSALIACMVLVLTACSLVEPTCEDDCDCPDRAAEVAPAWDQLAVEVASFEDQRPSSITFDKDGRAFLAFPWAEDPPEYSVVELLPDGEVKPFPSASWNEWDGETGATALGSFVCVQSIVADGQGSLWVLDSGSPRNRRGVISGAAKLVQIDLESNRVIDVIYFDARRFLNPETYLSALSIDADEQVAYLLDAHHGEVFVIDFKAGSMHCVFQCQEPPKHGDTLEDVLPGTETITDFAERLTYATGLQDSRSTRAGFALSNDAQWLYFHTTGRELFRISTSTIRDRSLTDLDRYASAEQIEHPCKLLSGIGFGKDGQLFLVDTGDDTLYKKTHSGAFQKMLSDPRLDQAESLRVSEDGYVYFTALRRERAFVPCDQEPEYTGMVLKFSPQKIELAQQLRLNADDLHAEAAWYLQLANAAEHLIIASETDVSLDPRQVEQEHAAAGALRERSLQAQSAANAAEKVAIEAEFIEGGLFSNSSDTFADVPTQTE